MNSAFIVALIAPFLWGASNLIDKYLMMYKVKNALSYAVIAGFANAIIGIIISLSLDWTGIALADMYLPAFVGILLGVQFYPFFLIYQKEDASHMVGLGYVFPILVALFSFVFLGERIAPLGYFGVLISVMGATLLSIRLRKIKLKIGLWLIVLLIFLNAIYEIFIKISTSNIPGAHGTAIGMIFVGLTLLPGLFHKKTRNDFKLELKNVKYAFVVELFTFGGMFCLYYSMKTLPVTVVSAVGAIQPIAVLMFERIAHVKFDKITRDKELLPKLISVVLITLGIALLYLSQ